jgi:hypothetical protein
VKLLVRLALFIGFVISTGCGGINSSISSTLKSTGALLMGESFNNAAATEYKTSVSVENAYEMTGAGGAFVGTVKVDHPSGYKMYLTTQGALISSEVDP